MDDKMPLSMAERFGFPNNSDNKIYCYNCGIPALMDDGETVETDEGTTYHRRNVKCSKCEQKDVIISLEGASMTAVVSEEVARSI
jgi:hypothetical protein